MFGTVKLVLFTVAVAVVGAQAQSTPSATATPTGVPGISQCALSCVTQSLSAGGCTSFTDLSCVCTSTEFQQAAQACLQANCTAEETAAAVQLQQTQCAAISASGSVSETGGPISSVLSSVSSVASSVQSSLSSRASSLVSSISSARSSATGPTSSTPTGSSTGGSSNNGAVAIGAGGILGVGVAFLGVVAGAGLLL
ncbi:hypothetical protein NLI96_g3465 [Meripilus lineatus]|uniref:CFEM domain-containing protein n=1 Tax=Meripilus lineatus TaxID=2056292 RepID=A0AAD5YFM4_9APHY|nr:hypothetical protein NLI96_g3465 [Physisporinus lineatus]